jgi:caffeoyl-CoA O-methyltransferase
MNPLKDTISPEITNYILNTGNRISQEKFDLINETIATFPDDALMLTHPPEGELLKMLVQLTGGRKGVEIGVFTGYSSLCLAEGLPDDGKLYALDISEDFTNLAKKYWKKANVDHKIELILAEGVTTLKQLASVEENLLTFDFFYIDADKANYDLYYELALSLLRPNGFIVFDNTLRFGRVVQESQNDTNTKALKVLNQKLRGDSRVSINMLGIADGVTIVRKI